MTTSDANVKAHALIAMLLFAAFVTDARADIFQWQYIDPANPGLGRQQSTILAPDGAGASAVRGANLSNRNLTKAYLIGANLGPEILSYDESNFPLDWLRSNLSNAILRDADLSHASLLGANLTGADLTDAEVRGAYFGSYGGFNYGGTGITSAQLYSTASYQARNLTGISLAGGNSLDGIDLSGQNLTGAYFVQSMQQATFSQANLSSAVFEYSDLSGADLTGTEIRDASFRGTNLATGQLASTASYQARDLTRLAVLGAVLTGADLSDVNLTGADFRGTNLAGANFTRANLVDADFSGNFFYYGGADLTGANLSHANLTNANFSGDDDSPGAKLTDANLTAADARGANFHRPRMDGALTANLIHSNGRIEALNLTGGASLLVRDYDGNSGPIPSGPLPITVDEYFTTDAAGVLRLEIDADPWDSTISFASGIPVTLGGTLELAFDPAVDAAAQIGRTIDLFDWTGVTPIGAFNVSSSHDWDLTNLYTTGEVTLTGLGAGLTGDFNGDNVVDAADLAKWKGDFGVNGHSDADGDGDTDGADFLAWQLHLGQAAAAATTAPVPEPASLTLWVAAALGVAAGRRPIAL